jgi:hypothetical protein
MVNLADLYRNQGLDGEAEPMLRRGVAADPGYAPAYHALGLLLAAPARLARRALRTPKGRILAPDDARLCLCLCRGAQLGGEGDGCEVWLPKTLSDARWLVNFRIMA